MATIYKEFAVNAPALFVWEALKDAGAVHTRLAQGFVVETVLSGNTRKVTFANGFVVEERLVSADDAQRRFVYSAVGGRTTHHNASFQVIPADGGGCLLRWVTDLLPDEARAAVEPMVEMGAAAIQKTLERNYLASTS